MSIQRAIRVGLGPLVGNPTVVNTSAADTTPVKALAAATQVTNRNKRRCRLLLVSTSAGHCIAWTTVAKDAAAPSLTADLTGTSTNGVLLTLAEPLAEFIIGDDKDLYIAASGTGVVYQLSYVEDA